MSIADSREIGSVTAETGALLLIDPMYILTVDDHDAGRDPESLAPGYDAVYVETRRDGSFSVVIEYDGEGAPVAIRIDLRS